MQVYLSAGSLVEDEDLCVIWSFEEGPTPDRISEKIRTLACSGPLALLSRNGVREVRLAIHEHFAYLLSGRCSWLGVEHTDMLLSCCMHMSSI
jgi:hypothetical protein